MRVDFLNRTIDDCYCFRLHCCYMLYSHSVRTSLKYFSSFEKASDKNEQGSKEQATKLLALASIAKVASLQVSSTRRG